MRILLILGCGVLASVTFAGGCLDREQLFNTDKHVIATTPKNDPLRRELEDLGVTVVDNCTDAEGTSHAFVASVRMEDAGLLAPALDAAKIGWGGSCGRGMCGMYVSIKHFYKAAEILTKEKERLGLSGWVWNREKDGKKKP